MLGFVPLLLIGGGGQRDDRACSRFRAANSTSTRITNEGSPVGVFANRNHHALLLAAAFPLLACWAALPHREPAYRRLRIWVALCIAASLFPLLLITGSRAGLLLGLIAALDRVGLCRRARQTPLRAASSPAACRGCWSWCRSWSGAVAIVAANPARRDEAFRRLFEDPDGRIPVPNLLPILCRGWRRFLPAGSGFGSFDPIFRTYEPDARCRPHISITRITISRRSLIEGGTSALLLVVRSSSGICRRLRHVVARGSDSPGSLIGRGGSRSRCWCC